LNIHPTAIIDPQAQIGEDCIIGPYCIIGNNVKLGKGCKLIASVFLDGITTIGEGCTFYPGVVIGTPPQDLKYKGEVNFIEIGKGNVFREYVTVHCAEGEGNKTIIGDENFFMAYVHVAHNCRLGNKIIIANSVGLSGHVQVEDRVILGGMVGVHQFVRIGKLSMIGGLSKINKDIPPYALVNGIPARLYGMNWRGLSRNGIHVDIRSQIKNAFKIIMHPQYNIPQIIEDIRTNVPLSPEIQDLLTFMENPSKMGVLVKAGLKAVEI
jgi:UDP-N-acetylglucosamine acyltransferase